MLSFWPFWLMLLIAGVVSSWLLFDGLRAFTKGDYVTPKRGACAGQLGPWAALFKRLGIEPRSVLAKGLHVVTGALWLVSGASLFLGADWHRTAMWVASIASLWYLPFGTLGGVLVIVLLLLVA